MTQEKFSFADEELSDGRGCHLGRGPLALIISGPAGVGKTTLCRNLVAIHGDRFAYAVTTTTRPPRSGERDGYDYYFVGRDKFQELLGHNAFYEHATVHGQHLYGLTRGEMERHFSVGHDVLLCMNVQGAMKLHRLAMAESEHFLHGRVVTIFLLPPDFNELRTRIQLRESIDEGELRRRMESIQGELRDSVYYDYLVPPGSRELALQNLIHIYHAEKMRGSCCGEDGSPRMS
ncbi:MAG: hypothetical protein LBS68_00115 [Puniceicoccales bacterium]|jgi:guanylate kinase|nr:hypothetical protein [Puniceicoccales bacterium]